MEEEKKSLEEEQKKKLEEEKKRFEELNRKLEKEKKEFEEEQNRKLEKEKKRLDEKQKRLDEEQKRLDEKQKRLDEEQERLDEEQERFDEKQKRLDKKKKRLNEKQKRKADEEQKRLDEEQKRKADEEQERLDEEQKRLDEEQKRKADEEQERLDEEQKRLEEEQNKKLEAEKKRLEAVLKSKKSEAILKSKKSEAILKSKKSEAVLKAKKKELMKAENEIGNLKTEAYKNKINPSDVKFFYENNNIDSFKFLFIALLKIYRLNDEELQKYSKRGFWNHKKDSWKEFLNVNVEGNSLVGKVGEIDINLPITKNEFYYCVEVFKMLKSKGLVLTFPLNVDTFCDFIDTNAFVINLKKLQGISTSGEFNFDGPTLKLAEKFYHDFTVGLLPLWKNLIKNFIKDGSIKVLPCLKNVDVLNLVTLKIQGDKGAEELVCETFTQSRTIIIDFHNFQKPNDFWSSYKEQIKEVFRITNITDGQIWIGNELSYCISDIEKLQETVNSFKEVEGFFSVAPNVNCPIQFFSDGTVLIGNASTRCNMWEKKGDEYDFSNLKNLLDLLCSLQELGMFPANSITISSNCESGEVNIGGVNIDEEGVKNQEFRDIIKSYSGLFTGSFVSSVKCVFDENGDVNDCCKHIFFEI